ncbi:phosphonate utilization associated transcriptional regulator [Diaphorobacter sp. HDW4B]|uniref:phosphonate utilization associated transcriptional regulator n=1 Tax=Diaphorobacter sp. HDW4B TaxID=2714925 RepID=UPI00140D94F5|nr:phosphonate utilization associated transcriptional regulator [Diaphorobacter sp. HDW4B]QIL71207.1 phosphonate utilization associated transcriptional regulator [Diaphorobacter sp. HDW4B]
MENSKPTSALAFLQSSSLPMLVQEEIERLIMTGELPVGSRINESDMAARFNTSRGPIREALRSLEEAGLLRTEKNRGMFVREISFEEADEIYELREAMEEIIGRRVSKAITPDGVDRLKAMIDAMRVAAQAENLEQYAQLNLQFHEILLDTAGSKKLTETYQRLIKELSLFRMRALDGGGGLRVSVDEHSHIVDAIASGDADRAGQALRQHVADSRARMHKAMGRPDSDSDSNSDSIPTTSSSTSTPSKEA